MLNSNGLSFISAPAENQHAHSHLSSYTEMLWLLRLEAEWSERTSGLALGQMDLELLSFLLTVVRKLFSITPVLLTLLDPVCPQTSLTGYFHLVQRAERAPGLLALRRKHQASSSCLCKALESLTLTLLLTHDCMFMRFTDHGVRFSQSHQPLWGHCAFDLARNNFSACRMIS